MPKETSDKPKYSIEINRKWCKNCGICVKFCPTAVFTEDELGGPVVTVPAKCTNCQLCVIRCPDFAIEVEPIENKTGNLLTKIFGSGK